MGPGDHDHDRRKRWPVNLFFTPHCTPPPSPAVPPGPLRLLSQAGLRRVGRGPPGRKASVAAIVALLVQGGLVVAAVSLCLRISVQRLLGGPKERLGGVGVHAAPKATHLNHGTPFLEEH